MKLRFSGFVLGLLVITLACSFSGPVTTPVDQPNVETIVAETMQALATPISATSAVETPAVAGTAVTFGNVSLVIPIGLASKFSGVQAPAIGEQEGGPSGAIPAHIELTLDGYLLQGKFHDPKIHVYPAQEFAAANAGAAQSLIHLQTLLLNPNGNITNDALPHVPFFNAAQIFAAQVKIIQFQNGSGVRMVTQYGQAVGPVANNSIFYHFEGLTGDGKYYIIVILPITAPMLASDGDPGLPIPAGGVPFPGYEGSAQDFDAYYNAITATLNAAVPETFNPTINILDALISSFQVLN